MALVVGTNSYMTNAEADTYFLDSLRNTQWLALTEVIQDQALVDATRYLDRLLWKGTKTVPSPTQILDWPRAGVIDDEGQAVPSGSVPQEIKDGQAEIALKLAEDPTLIDSIANQSGSNIKKVVAGDVEVEFFIPITGTELFEWVNALLKQFLSGSGLRFGSLVTGNSDLTVFDNASNFDRTRGYA